MGFHVHIEWLVFSEHPELLEMQRTKNEPLHDRLKGMEVKPDKVAEVTQKLINELGVICACIPITCCRMMSKYCV